MTSSQHVYEVRPRKDHRGVYLISDALPFRSAVVWRPKRNQGCNRYDKSLIRLLIILARQIFAALVSRAPDHISCVCRSE